MKPLYKTTVELWSTWKPSWPIMEEILNPTNTDDGNGHGMLQILTMHSVTEEAPTQLAIQDFGLNCKCDPCVCGREEY